MILSTHIPEITRHMRRIVVALVFDGLRQVHTQQERFQRDVALCGGNPHELLVKYPNIQ